MAIATYSDNGKAGAIYRELGREQASLRSLRGSRDEGRGEDGGEAEGCANGTPRGEPGEGGVARVPTRREQARLRRLRRSRGGASGLVGGRKGGRRMEEQRPSVAKRFS